MLRPRAPRVIAALAAVLLAASSVGASLAPRTPSAARCCKQEKRCQHERSHTIAPCCCAPGEAPAAGTTVPQVKAPTASAWAAVVAPTASLAAPALAAAWDDPTLAAESWNSPRAVPYDGAENNILKLSQRLPFPGKLGLKGRMAERDADMAAADARMTELTVLESVKQAYWDLWLTDRHLAVYTRDLELARELAAGAAGRYAVGTGGQHDVLTAEDRRT